MKPVGPAVPVSRMPGGAGQTLDTDADRAKLPLAIVWWPPAPAWPTSPHEDPDARSSTIDGPEGRQNR